MGFFDFLRGNNKTSGIDLVIKNAENGDAEAQFQLAKHYNDIEQYTESVKWLRLAVEKNHNNAKWYLALDYCAGCGIEKNYDKAIELAENMLDKDNDLRGAGLLGDIYSKKESNPMLGKYYNPELAEKYYLTIMRNGTKSCWLNKVYNLALLYGGKYIYNSDFFDNNITDPMKAVYCLYMSYLDGFEGAMDDLNKIVQNTDISITDELINRWKSDYVNKRCSI